MAESECGTLRGNSSAGMVNNVIKGTMCEKGHGEGEGRRACTLCIRVTMQDDLGITAISLETACILRCEPAVQVCLSLCRRDNDMKSKDKCG